MKIALILLFIIFGMTSICGQSKDLRQYFVKVSVELSERYKKGFEVEDCNERRSYWFSMFDYIMDDIDLTRRLISALYFFSEDENFDFLDIKVFTDDTDRKFKVLEYCVSEGYGLSICEMCADALRAIVENYINQVYIYLNYLGDNND